MRQKERLFIATVRRRYNVAFKAAPNGAYLCLMAARTDDRKSIALIFSYKLRRGVVLHKGGCSNAMNVDQIEYLPSPRFNIETSFILILGDFFYQDAGRAI